MSTDRSRDTESPSHQRPSFNDPLPGGIDPTAPGAPHEPGGEAFQQSQENPMTPKTALPDSEELPATPGKRSDV